MARRGSSFFALACASLLCAAAGAAETSALWSLEPIERPAPPAVKDAAWPLGEIDHFVLAKLEAIGRQPAPPLERQRLIRRAYFDLWGLPPSPEDVQAYVADISPDAYERLLDRLLASPNYGERWARHWLDIVRYADTNGYERDAEKPGSWRYRDWVIGAFNRDLPYDRFILEQLAGDELEGATDDTRVATGFLRIGTFDDEPNDPLQYKFEQLDDLVHATATSFMALTVRCARCHDHKFDAIPQSDYYAFLNFFSGGGGAGEGELLSFTEKQREPAPVKLLTAGDPRREAEIVPAGFLTMVSAPGRAIDAPADNATTSTRRMQLAKWLADPRHPLTARVMVNRIWLQHFGQGLCRTPDNFGAMSTAPTHPELLDWLASDFVAGGWHIKRLHKQIMLSSTYQMASTNPHDAEYAAVDFANESWYRANRRRLEAEAVRDSMLAVSGELNPQAGGPGFFPPVSADALEGLSMKAAAWRTSSPDEQRRRTIYMFTKRSLLSPLLTAFDLADTTQPCVQRSVTTVAPQALALLNNEFVHGRSTAFAQRVRREAGEAPEAQIERAWWLALGRAPSEAENLAAAEHLAAQHARFAALPAAAEAGAGAANDLALASLCHVLFNLNEFVYVD